MGSARASRPSSWRPQLQHAERGVQGQAHAPEQALQTTHTCTHEWAAPAACCLAHQADRLYFLNIFSKADHHDHKDDSLSGLQRPAPQLDQGVGKVAPAPAKSRPQLRGPRPRLCISRAPGAHCTHQARSPAGKCQEHLLSFRAATSSATGSCQPPART